MKSPITAVLGLCVVLSFVFAGCGGDNVTDSPTYRIVWTKYAANPVMHKTNAITELYAIGQPTCIVENDTIKMWFVAGGLPYITSRLLYATSTDGIAWTKYNNAAAVMPSGAAGEWDHTIDTPEIVRDSAGYKLFYFGDTLPGGTNQNPSPLAGLGVATSDDGIVWTKYAGNPILGRGANGSWEQSWIESPAVIWDSAGGEYLMWYSGVDTTSWRIGVGLATSPDGFVWTKYAGNPVIAPGPTGSYDDMWAAVPAVIRTDDGYAMWYSGFNSSGAFSDMTMNYATSPDGIHWTKFPGNPLFTTHTAPYSQAVDSGGPWAPDVVVFDSTYMMWYETVAGFGLATSDGKVVEQ